MNTRSNYSNNSPIPSLEMCSLVAMGGHRMNEWHEGSWRTTVDGLPREFALLEMKTPPRPRAEFSSTPLPSDAPGRLPSAVVWLKALADRLREWAQPTPAPSSSEVCTSLGR